MTLINKTILAAMVSIMAIPAHATVITLEEAEAKRIEIMNSDRSLKDKLEELRTLNQILEENEKILNRLEVKPKLVQPEEPKITSEPVNYAPPKGWEMNTVYVAEIFGIGGDITAEMFVDGEAIPPVDVVMAKESKEKFGSFVITSYTPTSITFMNTNTKESFIRRVTSAEQIAKKIEHNNKLKQQYQERYAIGTLEASLENFVDTNRSPIEVNYETKAVTPPVFDSMQGK
ncbi:hypothetical protein [Vibrio sp. TRT 29B02]|uniref:hypothetical protein n=1 Tax=Vibrio sp. TRT 29B02 TaxID=3418508 RepID=UPI003CF20EBB